jgi:integrase
LKLTQANTDRTALPAGKNEAILFDDDLPGFGLRLREGGAKRWIIQYSLGAKQRRMTLGSTKELNASEARAAAKKLLAKIALGHDPVAEKAERIAKASDAPFGDIIDRFLARQEVKLRPSSYGATRRYLKERWKPLHALHLRNISRADVSNVLGKIARMNGPISADRARAALSTFFSWAIGEGLCDVNPVVGTNKQVDGKKSRKRFLSDRELAIVWHSLPASDYGTILKLLILTGQRREEIAALQWSEVDLDARLINLPDARTKNGQPHDVPLSKPALAILRSQPARVGRDLLFGDGPRAGNDAERLAGFQGWSKAKDALDEAIVKAASEKGITVGAWVLHDLRRTMATRMADSPEDGGLGILPHVIEAVLNHISGHKAGVAGVYNRSSYSAEKKAALELWGKHVMALATEGHGDGQGIVTIPARAGK